MDEGKHPSNPPGFAFKRRKKKNFNKRLKPKENASGWSRVHFVIMYVLHTKKWKPWGGRAWVDGPSSTLADTEEKSYVRDDGETYQQDTFVGSS